MVFRRVFWDRGVLFGACHCLIRALAKTGRGLSACRQPALSHQTILVTIACNVPLNDALAAVDTSGADAGHVWTTYLRSWTAWNHVRTIAALVAAGSFTIALCQSTYR